MPNHPYLTINGRKCKAVGDLITALCSHYIVVTDDNDQIKAKGHPIALKKKFSDEVTFFRRLQDAIDEKKVYYTNIKI
jgi:hypothetical protein